MKGSSAGAHLGHWDFNNSYWTTYDKLARAGTTVSPEPNAFSRANRSSLRPNYCHLNTEVEVTRGLCLVTENKRIPA